ncbi:MAG: glycerol-3-phosphate dehydrogenase [Candidatus Dormibacteraeota bacterium]|nr:glycerol-3-phosphate dehydrogenase [Candidatus Dormibacteraeota bacterium]
MATVAILGSGIMGSGLTVPLAENGHDVRLVGTHLDREIIDSIKASGVHPGLQLKLPESVRAYQLEEVEAGFEGAEIVLSGVNSFGVRWAGEQLARLLRPGMHLIAIAKGMDANEQGDLRILPEVLAEQVPADLRSRVSWSAIVGPSIAGEVAVRRHTCVIFAGHDQAALDRLAATFRTDRYHVWTSTDLLGAEVCAAMKNCYALSVGIAEGDLDRQAETDSPYRAHNYEAALFGQGAIEIGQMLRLLGGRPETANGLAGVGDMYVTSAGGRNVRVGHLIGTGLTYSEAHERLGRHITLEGAAAIRVIGAAIVKQTERGIISANDFPLMRALFEVMGRDRQLEIPWSRLFSGEPVADGVDRS